jgi:hypothetical protein
MIFSVPEKRPPWYADSSTKCTRLVNPIWRVELDLRRVEGARE